jgi:hypothetical protein
MEEMQQFTYFANAWFEGDAFRS